MDQVVSSAINSIKKTWSLTLTFFLAADNLEEVNVPIMKSCKDVTDINGNEICAGEINGGHDACQGRKDIFQETISGQPQDFNL